MGRIADEARKKLGLPELSEGQRAKIQQDADRLRDKGHRMQSTGCMVTIAALLFLILFALL